MADLTPQRDAVSSSRLSPQWRIAISVLLAIHLMALVAAPLAVQPSSLLFGDIWTVFSPYLQATFINHGYHFFAPEPGPSHLIRYEVVREDGKRQEGSFPNLVQHQPRLLYHRHFMLTEFVNSSLGPVIQGAEEGEDGEPPIDIKQVPGWHRAYARHLLHKFDGERVTLTLVRHQIPRPNAVLVDGMTLTDPSLYEERSLGSYQRGEL